MSQQRSTSVRGPTEHLVSPLRTDSFSWPNNTVFASIPVYGPELFVEFDNKGSQQQTCDGNIYAIQEVP